MTRWGYKTVHFAMKKEGLLGGVFLDETEIEQELNEFGRSGWELVHLLEMHDGIIAFFKQPLGQRAVGDDDDREFFQRHPAQGDRPGRSDESAITPDSSSRQPSAREPLRQTERSGAAVVDDNGIGAIKIE